MTSAYCKTGIEPVVNIGLPTICLTGQKPPIAIDDTLDSTTTVPAGGTYAWHIDPSTRPFVAKTGQKEAYTLTCEQPDGGVIERLSLVIDRGQTVNLNIGCGGGPTTFGNGAPVGGSPDAPPGTTRADGQRHPGAAGRDGGQGQGRRRRSSRRRRSARSSWRRARRPRRRSRPPRSGRPR